MKVIIIEIMKQIQVIFILYWDTWMYFLSQEK